MASLLNVSKTITIEFSHLEMTGVAKIICWDGDTAVINMDKCFLEYSVETINSWSEDELKAELKKHINDGGFGCERIIGAYCYITAVYANGGKAAVYELPVNVNGELTDKDMNELMFAID